MRGRYIPLSRMRRVVCDLMDASSGVPTVPVQRACSIAPVNSARRIQASRPSWHAIFAKAFGLVAREMPEFRRAYCSLPWPHICEYPVSVASVTVEREEANERGVLFVRIKDPASAPLAELSRAIRVGATTPIDDVSDFRPALRVAALPRPLRRLCWWFALNVGRQRANYFGTFGLSVSSPPLSDILHPRSPLTAVITYGLVAADGAVLVRLIFDHRVLDARTASRGLERLEDVLNTAIVHELTATDTAGRSKTPPSASA